MAKHLDPKLSAEIRHNVGHLPPYKGDPKGLAVDYTNAAVAYAVNVVLIHGGMRWHNTGRYLPTADTKVLLVERASGDGKIGSKSGVSGYIDVLYDPDLLDEAFDPIAYAARTELEEEVGISPSEVSTIDLYLGARVSPEVNLALGGRFEEVRFGGTGTLHVLPLLGICHGPELPPIQLNPAELRSFDWVPLCEVVNHPDLSPGYLEQTLPHALGTTGLSALGVRRCLFPGLN